MSPKAGIAVAATIGAIAGLGEMPYGYYNLLRLGLCGSCLYLLVGPSAVRLDWQRWFTGGCAVLYNPIAPIRIVDKGIWIVLNVATIAWLWFLAAQSSKRT